MAWTERDPISGFERDVAPPQPAFPLPSSTEEAFAKQKARDLARARQRGVVTGLHGSCDCEDYQRKRAG